MTKCQTQIANMDVLEWCKREPEVLHHAMLCDPPYGLNFMNKSWDNDIAFQPETWAAFLPHLHPGAMCLAFAGTRGYHRMACAIEDAGYILHPMMVWAFGCLSEDTEILTRNGWEPYHKAIAGIDVLCYNNSEGTYSFQPVQEQCVYDYNETAYRIHSERTDQLVSRNHRCLVKRANGFEFVTAERLTSQETVPILEDLPGLLSALRGVDCEGVSQQKDMQQGVCKLDTQSKSVSASYQADAGTNGERYGLSELRESDLETERMDTQGRGRLLLKVVPCNIQTCAAVDTSLWEWEGQITTRHRISRREESGVEGRGNVLQNARQLQGREICTLPETILGNGAKRRVRNGASTFGSTSNWAQSSANRSGSPCRPQCNEQLSQQSDAVLLESRSQALRTSQYTISDLATVTPVHYQGKVWCVRVPTGAFVARRNGRIFVTGNSGFPKATRVKGDSRFAGHRYGRQLIKPAVEVILCFQKPYAGRPIESITATGAGTINIEAGRIGTGNESPNGGGSHSTFVYGGGNGGNVTPTAGRWPSNFLLDEESAMLLDSQSGNSTSKSGDRGNVEIFKKENGWVGKPTVRGHNDAGGSSRFFFQSNWQAEEHEPFLSIRHCILCECFLSDKEGYNDKEVGINPTKEESLCHKENSIHEAARIAMSSINPPEENKSSVLGNAQPKQLLETEDSSQNNSLHASIAQSNLKNTAGISESTVQDNALLTTNVQLLQNVKSAASLCDSCATAIAQSLALTVQGQDPVFPLGQVSISVRRRQTLLQCLAQFVESREKTDTIPTIASLKVWFGFVSHAIANITNWESPGQKAQCDPTNQNVLTNINPFFYCAKAGRTERDAGLEEFPLIASEKIQQRKNNGSGELLNGTGTVAPLRNTHPTVKPVRLTKYLASLLSPPPECAPRRILVPFSGSGSEMVGCILSGGWEFVQGIEMNTEYVRISEARIKFWQMNSGLFESLTEDDDDAPIDAQETLF